MLLKEAQDLLLCRHLLIVEDAASRLSDPLLYQRHKVLQALQQAPGPRLLIGVPPQRSDDPYRLSTARLGDRDQLLVSLFELLTSFLSFAPCEAVSR
jgi:hypothetical protein